MITRKIAAYLRQDLALDKQLNEEVPDEASRQAVIDYFENSKGVCAGISTLWSYGRLIDDDEQTDKTQKIDDIHFFKHVHDMLINWDEKSALTPAQKQDIKRFVYHIMMFQRSDVDLWVSKKADEHVFRGVSADQHELEVLLEDTKRGKPKSLVNEEDWVLTKEMLKDRLESFVTAKSLITIGSNIYQADKSERFRERAYSIGHAVSIYKCERDGRIYYFDINGIYDGSEERKYEVTVNNMDELVELIWTSTNPENFTGAMEGRLFSDIFSKNVRSLNFRKHKFEVHLDPQEVLGKEALTQMYQASEKEAFDLVLANKRFMTSIATNTRTKVFIRKLDDVIVIKLLASPGVEDGVKSAIVFSLLTDYLRNNSLFLNKYLASNIAQTYFEEAIKEYEIDESKITSLTEKASRSMLREYLNRQADRKWRAERSACAKVWLELYDDGILGDADIHSLSLTDALYLLESRLGDIEFMQKILTGRNHDESSEFEMMDIGGCLFLTALCNLKEGNITYVNKLLEKCGKEHGVFLSIDALGDLKSSQVAEFMYETFPYERAYLHVLRRHSYLPSLIENLKRKEGLPYRIKEAIKSDDLEKLKELLQEGSIDATDIRQLQALDLEGYNIADAAGSFASINILEYLAGIGMRFDLADESGRHPLWYLLVSEKFKDEYRDVESCLRAVEIMLKAGADTLVKQAKRDWPNIIHHVINTDFPELITVLKNAGADLDHLGYKDCPALWTAAVNAADIPCYPPVTPKPAMYERMIAEGADIKKALVYADKMIAQGYGDHYKNAIELLQQSFRKRHKQDNTMEASEPKNLVPPPSSYEPRLFTSNTRTEPDLSIDLSVIKKIINDSAFWKSKRKGGILLPDGINKLQKAMNADDEEKLKADFANIAQGQLDKSKTDRRQYMTKSLYQLLVKLPSQDSHQKGLAKELYEMLVQNWKKFNNTPRKKLF